MTLTALFKKAGISTVASLSYANTIQTTVMVLTGEQLLKLFPLEEIGTLPEQRNDEERVKTKKASHITELNGRPDSQAEFHAVWFKGRLQLVNGNHRVRVWHTNRHLLMAFVQLTIYEPQTEAQREALYNSFDNRKAVKGSQDDLWSVFNYAGIAKAMTSTQMKTGRNLATVMKHFLPGTSISTRAKAAKRKADVLDLADKLLAKLPTDRKASEIFGAAEMLAFLEVSQGYKDAGNTAAMMVIVDDVLPVIPQYVSFVLDGSRHPSKPALADAFLQYEEVARLQGHKRTGEKVVLARAAILKPLLESYVTSCVKAKKRTARRAAAV
ncbi:TPA: hypothetical protein QDB04_000334 [Burkholderia vietnamiensis]|nr:hypothetical protein [Burkholderia vietnamiensis]